MSEPLQLKIAGPFGLLLLFAAGCALIGHHQAAAAREWSRYLGGKTSEAEAGLVAMRDDEEAKFLLANIALAHGAHDRAASLTAELRGRHPEDVELQLLEHLVRRREDHPEGSWLDLYGEAWRALSRPALPNVFAASGWVTFREPPVPEATRRAVKGTPLQLLVDWGPCVREKRADRVRVMVREPLAPDLRVLALRCVQYRKGMDARRKELEDQVALDFPESVEFGLPALADDLDGDGPLPPSVLDRLQRLLSRPVFSLPHGRLYQSYRERLQAAGLPQPEVQALYAADFARDVLNVAVLRSPLLRTRRTGDPDTSIRAAALSGGWRARSCETGKPSAGSRPCRSSGRRPVREIARRKSAVTRFVRSCLDSSRTPYPLPRLRWPGPSLPSIRKSRMRWVRTRLDCLPDLQARRSRRSSRR